MIRETYSKAYPSSHANSLWGWTSLQSAAEACLLGLTSKEWEGHEVFYIVADEVCWEGGLEPGERFKAGELERMTQEEGKEVKKIGTVELVERYHPGAKVKVDWWKNNPRRGCFDCTKAERLLGWRHDSS